jgi:arsenite oxidase small subunit
MEDVKLNRRFFLKSGGATAAVVGSVVIPIQNAEAAAPAAPSGGTTLPYPNKVVGKARGMAINQVINFSYPDASSPCYAIRMGTPVDGGVGPDGDIVAYSALCTHMGIPLAYDSAARVFKCSGHYSMFDPEKNGQMVCGQATEELPKIVLQYDAKTDSVHAMGVSGLIYGRQSNIL